MVLVFTQFMVVAKLVGRIAYLEKKKFLYYTGDMSANARKLALTKFKTDKSVKILVRISIFVFYLYLSVLCTDVDYLGRLPPVRWPRYRYYQCQPRHSHGALVEQPRGRPSILSIIPHGAGEGSACGPLHMLRY